MVRSPYCEVRECKSQNMNLNVWKIRKITSSTWCHALTLTVRWAVFQASLTKQSAVLPNISIKDLRMSDMVEREFPQEPRGYTVNFVDPPTNILQCRMTRRIEEASNARRWVLLVWSMVMKLIITAAIESRSLDLDFEVRTIHALFCPECVDNEACQNGWRWTGVFENELKN